MSTTCSPSRRPSAAKPGLIAPKRALFQWLTSLTLLGIPFVRVGGDSLLRLDLPTLTLHAFGQRFPVTDLSLFLLLAIALTLLFLLVTLAFGRAWCGWACPQTTLVDLVEWFAGKLGIGVRAGRLTATSGQQFGLQLFIVALSLLVGANLVWYFVPPDRFFRQLFSGELHGFAVLTFGLVALCTWLDLTLVRRLLCKEFCPYGRFQTVLIDPGTLTLHYHPAEAPRCIRCGACVRACPTGIDIRDGYQIECINCGRCLDACRQVMARRQQDGIIRYTFGLHDRGVRALVNGRTGLLGLALAGTVAALFLTVTLRAPVVVKLARNPELPPRSIGAEQVVNFYSVYLTNRGQEPLTIALRLDEAADTLHLSGPTGPQQLAGGEKRRLNVAIHADAAGLRAPRPATLLIVDTTGKPLNRAKLYLTAPVEHHD
ncbi:MAG: 4Fe-4S dicluster domain-containing protein [Desulfuromonadales bacterium]|nr:4Fe-4S dicluster domain-containing protein [Desulfuromonadales bacterium]